MSAADVAASRGAVAIATPTSAAASAGASLIPSPTCAIYLHETSACAMPATNLSSLALFVQVS